MMAAKYYIEVVVLYQQVMNTLNDCRVDKCYMYEGGQCRASKKILSTYSEKIKNANTEQKLFCSMQKLSSTSIYLKYRGRKLGYFAFLT